MTATLKTERLTLRPLEMDDAAAVRAHCGNWSVARMLARVPHPYPEGLAEQWIAGHEAERAAGRDYNFGIDLDGTLIGVISLERDEPGVFVLGYWLGEPWWGQGLMSEAVQRVTAFGFEALSAEELSARYMLENPASSRVLAKCGFEIVGEEDEIFSLARDAKVRARRMSKARRDALEERAAS